MPLTLEQMTAELHEVWQALVRLAETNKELRSAVEVLQQQQQQQQRPLQRRPAPPSADSDGGDSIACKRRRLAALLEGTDLDSDTEDDE
jgi:hypothetical protein